MTMTLEQFNQWCRLFRQPEITEEELQLARKSLIPSIHRAIVGVFDVKEMKGYHWRITPSSEDKGYSDR